MSEQSELSPILQETQYQTILGQLPDKHSEERVARVCNDYIRTVVIVGEGTHAGEFTDSITLVPSGTLGKLSSLETSVPITEGLVTNPRASGPQSSAESIMFGMGGKGEAYQCSQLGYGVESRKFASGWGIKSEEERRAILSKIEAQTHVLERVFNTIGKIPDSPGGTVTVARQKAELAKEEVKRLARELPKEGGRVEMPLGTWLDFQWLGFDGEKESLEQVTRLRVHTKASVMKEIGTDLIRFRIINTVASSGWDSALKSDPPESVVRTAQEVAIMGHRLNELNRYPREELDTPEEVMAAMKIMATFLSR